MAAVSAADLRTISLVDAGDPLAIWNFVEAASRLRDKGVRVQVWNALDEYGFYRQHDYSFYVGDDRLPDVIYIPPADFARPLRSRVARLLDVHAVPHYVGRNTVEVVSFHGNPEIPIYVPAGPRIGRITVFVGCLDVPVWILAPDETEDEALYAELADAVAYWLWQAKDDFNGRLIVDSLVTMEVLVAEDLEAVPEDQAESLPAVVIERTGEAALKILFTSTFHSLVRQPDNQADRELLKALLLALTRLSSEADAGQNANAIVDRVAPLGLKKKLLSFNLAANPTLDTRGLPAYRGV